ncbi:hypothetical protein AZE42_05828 [Rhizopogon vesiculosus]|uniref:Uncharacterized protein n=1 Tax=Rhizopogon vesiculosus TaxID=180088 RepID=A0A1J8PWG6_9AGAM|nr:hypothetical protein AZE42_05828 [Rhizopogon vesiculosus]
MPLLYRYKLDYQTHFANSPTQAFVSRIFCLGKAFTPQSASQYNIPCEERNSDMLGLEVLALSGTVTPPEHSSEVDARRTFMASHSPPSMHDLEYQLEDSGDEAIRLPNKGFISEACRANLASKLVF